MAVDKRAAAKAVSDLLEALGHPTAGSAELSGTPARVAEAFADELLAGYSVDVSALLEEATPVGNGSTVPGDVTVRGIHVATVCPHHLLPGIGQATVSYGPGSRLLGIGAVARIVDAFARRLTLQEAIGQNVVDALVQSGGARWAVCRIELLHTCLVARGARQSEARVVTIARAGCAPPDSP